MRAPTRILANNGVRQQDLAKITGQSVQYVSMQLNGHRPITTDLTLALRELLSPTLADEVIRRRGEV